MRALAEVGGSGTVAALRNPHPIAERLPGVYREAFIDEHRRTARESFGSRFLAAFDDVLAPVIATLDNLDAYLDPGTTPEDFLAWLGTWVAAPVDEGWSLERRRDFVARAAELYRRRGTAAGLREHVAVHTGGTVEIIENGASTWSAKADGKLPGSPEPVVVVRVTVADPSAIDAAKLDAIVRTSKPAHVVHRVEVVGPGGPSRAGRRARASEATAETSESSSPPSAEATDDASVPPGTPPDAAPE